MCSFVTERWHENGQKRLKEVNAKCLHLKKLSCKGNLQQVFIRVYRLEIANFLRTFIDIMNERNRELFNDQMNEKMTEEANE